MPSEPRQRASALAEELAGLPDQELWRQLAALEHENPELAAEVISLLASEESSQRAPGRTEIVEDPGDGAQHKAPAPDQPGQSSESTAAPASTGESPAGSETETVQLPPDETPTAWIGRRLGPWMLVRRIGQGGMGEVYLAERADQRFSGQAAIKLVRAGPGKYTLLDRFHSEGEILAQLDHPGIARLLDAGATEEEWPYLVMEYVDGEPITRYCDQHRCTLDQRLALFMQICAAMQHAHASLIVHRDLKPSNILVTEDGRVKLLDFGIAKLLEPTTGGGRQTTQLALTPGYASPEQVRGESTTTATDVHALGLLLYELLTERAVFKIETDHTPEMIRKVVMAEPPPPSTVVDDNRMRARRLRGDLDAIVMKALKKDANQRYRSVEQLANDIQRYRDYVPVQARGASVGYRLVKFMRRNTWPVAGVLGLIVLLATGLGMVARQAELARTERERAEQRFDQVRELASSMLFDVYNSIIDVPEALEARELLLSQGTAYLESLAGEAGHDAELMWTLGHAYERFGDIQSNPYRSDTGDVGAALDSYRRAVSMRQQLVERMNELPVEQHRQLYRDLARSHDRVGELLEWQEDFEQAGTAFLAARQLRERVHAGDPGSLTALRDLADSDFRLGRLAQARSDLAAAHNFFSSGLERYRVLYRYDPDHEQTLAQLSAGLGALGELALQQGQFAQAQDLLEESFELATRRGGRLPGDPEARRELILALSRLGLAAERAGDFATALAIHEEVRAETEALVEAHPADRRYRRDLIAAHSRLAAVYRATGRAARAATHMATAIRHAEALVAQAPANITLRLELAQVLRSGAEIAFEADGHVVAARLGQQASEVLEELLKEHGERVPIKLELARFYLLKAGIDPVNAHRHRGRASALLAELQQRGQISASERHHLLAGESD